MLDMKEEEFKTERYVLHFIIYNNNINININAITTSNDQGKKYNKHQRYNGIVYYYY